jgi:hypothetical protein
MDSAFCISWKAPVSGRGKDWLKLVVELEKYWGKQVAQGHCTTPDVFLLPNGPGTVTVRGERRVLEGLTTRADFGKLLAQGRLLFQDWHYGFAKSGADNSAGADASIVVSSARGLRTHRTGDADGPGDATATLLGRRAPRSRS